MIKALEIHNKFNNFTIKSETELKKARILVKNIIKYAGEGSGISDIDFAMTDGYSTSNGLGKGLCGTKELVDDFFIKSEVGKGTEVRIIKWLR